MRIQRVCEEVSWWKIVTDCKDCLEGPGLCHLCFEDTSRWYYSNNINVQFLGIFFSRSVCVPNPEPHTPLDLYMIMQWEMVTFPVWVRKFRRKKLTCMSKQVLECDNVIETKSSMLLRTLRYEDLRKFSYVLGHSSWPFLCWLLNLVKIGNATKKCGKRLNIPRCIMTIFI